MSSSTGTEPSAKPGLANLHWESLSVTLLAGGAAVAFLGSRLTTWAE